jgi:hypothetical protein
LLLLWFFFGGSDVSLLSVENNADVGENGDNRAGLAGEAKKRADVGDAPSPLKSWHVSWHPCFGSLNEDNNADVEAFGWRCRRKAWTNVIALSFPRENMIAEGDVRAIVVSPTRRIVRIVMDTAELFFERPISVMIVYSEFVALAVIANRFRDLL